MAFGIGKKYHDPNMEITLEPKLTAIVVIILVISNTGMDLFHAVGVDG